MISKKAGLPYVNFVMVVDPQVQPDMDWYMTRESTVYQMEGCCEAKDIPEYD